MNGHEKLRYSLINQLKVVDVQIRALKDCELSVREVQAWTDTIILLEWMGIGLFTLLISCNKEKLYQFFMACAQSGRSSLSFVDESFQVKRFRREKFRFIISHKKTDIPCPERNNEPYLGSIQILFLLKVMNHYKPAMLVISAYSVAVVF